MAWLLKIVATETGKVIGEEINKKLEDLDPVVILKKIKDIFEPRSPTAEEVLQFKTKFNHELEFQRGFDTKRITTGTVDTTIGSNKLRLLLGFGNGEKSFGVEKLGVQYFPTETSISLSGLVNFGTPRNPSLCLLLKAQEKEMAASGKILYKPFAAEQKLTTFADVGYVTPSTLLNLYKGEDSLGGVCEHYITKTMTLRASAEHNFSTKETNIKLGVGKDVSDLKIAIGATVNFPGTETAVGGNAAREGGGRARIDGDANYYTTINGEISTDYKGACYKVKGSVSPYHGKTKIGLAWTTIE